MRRVGDTKTDLSYRQKHTEKYGGEKMRDGVKREERGRDVRRKERREGGGRRGKVRGERGGGLRKG